MKYKHNKRARIIEELITIVVLSVIIAGLVFFLLIKPYLDNVVEDIQAEQWQLVDNQLEALYYNNKTEKLESVKVDFKVQLNYGQQKTAPVNKLEPKVSDVYYQVTQQSKFLQGGV